MWPFCLDLFVTVPDGPFGCIAIHTACFAAVNNDYIALYCVRMCTLFKIEMHVCVRVLRTCTVIGRSESSFFE